MRRLATALLALVLAGCAVPSGMPVTAFPSPEIENAYIPLEAPYYVVLREEGAAVSLGNGIAVTSGHNADLVDPKLVIGSSPDYDLMFFHTERTAALPTDAPRVPERVIAFGQYDGVLRRAEGNVLRLDAPVAALCKGCTVQSAFTFDGNAGPGFSGGPVLDAQSERLVGVIFGFIDRPEGGRTIYAYTMERVTAELRKIEDKPPGKN